HRRHVVSPLVPVRSPVRLDTIFCIGCDQHFRSLGHHRKKVPAKSAARLEIVARNPPPPAPTSRLARPRAVVAHWKVSRDRAFYPVASADDGAKNVALRPIGEILSRTRLIPPAARATTDAVQV